MVTRPSKICCVATLLFLFFNLSTNAQQRIGLAAAFDTAIRNNLQINAADLQLQRSRLLTGTWFDIPKTGIFAENEDLRPGDRKGILKIGVSQSLDWPGLYRARKTLLQEQVKSLEYSKELKSREIRRDLQGIYYDLWYLQSKQYLWIRLDSIYTSLFKAAALRVKTGDSAGLDSIAAQAKSREISVQLRMLNRDIRVKQEGLRRFLNTSIAYLPEELGLKKIPIQLTDTTIGDHIQWQLQQQAVNIAGAELNVVKQGRKPGFDGRFFSQHLYGVSPPFSGFSVTASFPIFTGTAYRSRIRAAELERSYQQSVLDYERLNMNVQYRQFLEQLQKDNDMVTYYESTGLQQAEGIIKAANISYRAGEISFAELTQFFTQAIDIQKNYLDVLNGFNQSAIQLNYYLNK